jgi:hypothetical protein
MTLVLSGSPCSLSILFKTYAVFQGSYGSCFCDMMYSGTSNPPHVKICYSQVTIQTAAEDGEIQLLSHTSSSVIGITSRSQDWIFLCHVEACLMLELPVLLLLTKAFTISLASM